MSHTTPTNSTFNKQIDDPANDPPTIQIGQSELSEHLQATDKQGRKKEFRALEAEEKKVAASIVEAAKNEVKKKDGPHYAMDDFAAVKPRKNRSSAATPNPVQPIVKSIPVHKNQFESISWADDAEEEKARAKTAPLKPVFPKVGNVRPATPDFIRGTSVNPKHLQEGSWRSKSEDPKQIRSSGKPKLVNKVASTSPDNDKTAAWVAEAKNLEMKENQEYAKASAEFKAIRAEKQRQGEDITVLTPPLQSLHRQVVMKDGKRTVTGTTVTTHDSTDVLVKKGSVQDNKATEAKEEESEEESDELDDDSDPDAGIGHMGAPPRPSKAEREAARKALSKAAKAKTAEAVASPALPPSIPSVNKDTPPSLKKETQVSHDDSPRMEITTKSEPVSKPQPTVNPRPGEQTSSSSERAQSDKLQVSTVRPVWDAKQKAEARTAAEDNKPRQSGSSKGRPPTKAEILEMANVAKIQQQQFLASLGFHKEVSTAGRTKESPHPRVPSKASGNPSPPVPGSAPSQKPQTSSSQTTQVDKASQAQAKTPVSLNEAGVAAAQIKPTVPVGASGPATEKEISTITPQAPTPSAQNTSSNKPNTAQETQSNTAVKTPTTEAVSSDITGTMVIVRPAFEQGTHLSHKSSLSSQAVSHGQTDDTLQSVAALRSEIRQTAITHAFETKVLGHGLSAIRETQDTVFARIANQIEYCQLIEQRLREQGLTDSPVTPMIEALRQDLAHTAENMAIETDAGINDVVADLATGRREVATYIETATRPSPTPVPSSSAIFIPWHQRPRVRRFTQPAPLDPDVQTDSETLAALLANPPL